MKNNVSANDSCKLKVYQYENRLEAIIPYPSISPARSRGIYFLHIPKCGGTSCALALMQIAASASIPAIRSLLLDDLFSSEFANLPSYGLLTGHLGSIPIEWGMDGVTVMRNPVEHMISWYIAITSSTFFIDSFGFDFVSLGDFLHDSRFLPFRFNVQAKWLGFCDHKFLQTAGLEIDLLGDISTAPTSLNDSFLSLNLDETESSMYIAAKKTLDRCLFVGTSEKLADWVNSIASYLSVASVGVPTENITSEYNESILEAREEAKKPDILALINHNTRVDSKLYEHVLNSGISLQRKSAWRFEAEM